MPNGTRADCRQKALELLARRPHFTRELAAKLAARGFSPAQIETCVTELESRGLLDDQREALALASGPMMRRGFGPRRIEAELRRRGVEQDVASAVLSELFPRPADELDRARDAADRWRRRGRGAGATLMRHLDRKGFSKAVILRLMEEHAEE